MKSDGYSLLEVMLASAILLLTTGALGSAYVVCMRSATFAEKHADAMHRTRMRLETLRSYHYMDPRLSVGTHQIPGGSYTVASGLIPRTKNITVAMLWHDASSSTTARVELATSIGWGLHQ